MSNPAQEKKLQGFVIWGNYCECPLMESTNRLGAVDFSFGIPGEPAIFGSITAALDAIRDDIQITRPSGSFAGSTGALSIRRAAQVVTTSTEYEEI